jgi:hypothetical protein
MRSFSTRLRLTMGLLALAMAISAAIILLVRRPPSPDRRVSAWLLERPSFAVLPGAKPSRRFSIEDWTRRGRDLPECREILERLLDGDSRMLAERAAFALGYLGDKRSIPRLIAAIQTADAQTRVCAIWSLGRLGNDESVPVLARVAITDTEDNAVEAAIDALCSIGTPSATTHLRSLAERDDHVGHLARVALWEETRDRHRVFGRCPDGHITNEPP